MAKRKSETKPAHGETKGALNETPPPGEFRCVAVADLIPTPDNVRTVRAIDPKVKDLVESIRKVGVLQPVVARPHPTMPGKLDLRAGARRHMAAGLAGCRTIPCMVREMDDITAKVVTVLENMEREDLTPMEESRAVGQLLEAGFSVQDAAAKMGKSPTFVARRAALSKLAKCWQEDEENNWPAAWLERVAPLPADVQEHLYNDSDWIQTIRQLDSHISGYTHELRRAKWPLDDPALLAKAGACIECAKRSSCHPGLFDIGFDAEPKEIQKKDRCLDAECWEKKEAAYVERRKRELTAEHGKVIMVGGEAGQTSPWKITRVKKDHPKAQPCVDEHGELFWGTTSYGEAGGKSADKSSHPKASAGDAAARKRIAEAFATARLAAVIATKDFEQMGQALSTGLAACTAHRLAAGTLNHHQGTREARKWLEHEMGLAGKNGWPESPLSLAGAHSAGVLFASAGALAFFDQAHPVSTWATKKCDWLPEVKAEFREEAAKGFVITGDFLSVHLRADISRVAVGLGLAANTGATKSNAVKAILDAKLPAGSLTPELAKAFGVKYSKPKAAAPAKAKKAKKAKAVKSREAAG